MARSKEYRVKIKIKGGFQDKECQGIMWIILVVMVEVPLKVSLAREGMEMALKHKFACSLSKKNIFMCAPVRCLSGPLIGAELEILIWRVRADASLVSRVAAIALDHINSLVLGSRGWLYLDLGDCEWRS